MSYLQRTARAYLALGLMHATAHAHFTPECASLPDDVVKSWCEDRCTGLDVLGKHFLNGVREGVRNRDGQQAAARFETLQNRTLSPKSTGIQNGARSCTCRVKQNNASQARREQRQLD
ncbi:hypothetical protein DFH11DRAFT_1592679 [Phellopilus nigrolimitatus]|nr:hypothetical protein DFH11DRAFT_1592634 [Phellopilus nigrolimitatus]KAH8114672.1 hypothetical protein DFH11DRAFT_1592679 [Phellopilus nigrolimitatus]